jgi:hypothetical protein
MADEENIGNAARDRLSFRRDPFAAREGKTLSWKGVNMIVVCRPFYLFSIITNKFLISNSSYPLENTRPKVGKK